MKKLLLYAFILFLIPPSIHSQNPSFFFSFDGHLQSNNMRLGGIDAEFTKGLDGQALLLQSAKGYNNLRTDSVFLNGSHDFSLCFWVKISSDQPMTLLSQKDFSNKGMAAQKNPGWALFCSGGTFAWNIGSGNRRLTYERDNGGKMPLSDGQWHQLGMTYSKDLKEVRLYYDGKNRAIYKVGFNFNNTEALLIGTQESDRDYTRILPEITDGRQRLQALADAYNSFGFGNIKDEQFIELISDPEALFGKTLSLLDTSKQNAIKSIRKELLSSQYTVYQIRELSLIKPLNKIYSLRNGELIIDTEAAMLFTKNEQLFPADFAMDNLHISPEVLSAGDIREDYEKYTKTSIIETSKSKSSLTVAVWNIWHGGLHFTEEEYGWDSRKRIAHMLKEKEVDVILMQETYSSGDYIAAELGWYFATTSDWDYRMQGSNISVISRYPITEVFVPEEASFMNVGAKLQISEEQEIFAMSNWYGMSSFPLVYEFHEERFAHADVIPVLFGGDFNAVPHTDGGTSPASLKLLSNGFTDAYRSLHPDVKMDPAYTHSSGSRIDQLYYKGSGLKNISTEIISKWPGGFPSDHFMILSEYELGF